MLLPGEVEDLHHSNGMVVAVGGDQLKLFHMEEKGVGLMQTNYILEERLQISPRKLLSSLLKVELQGKKIHSANFSSKNSLIISFVDSSPTKKNSIL